VNLDASVSQTHLLRAKPDDNKSWAGSSDGFFSFGHIGRHPSLLRLSTLLRGAPVTGRQSLAGGWDGDRGRGSLPSSLSTRPVALALSSRLCREARNWHHLLCWTCFFDILRERFDFLNGAGFLVANGV